MASVSCALGREGATVILDDVLCTMCARAGVAVNALSTTNSAMGPDAIMTHGAGRSPAEWGWRLPALRDLESHARTPPGGFQWRTWNWCSALSPGCCRFLLVLRNALSTVIHTQYTWLLNVAVTALLSLEEAQPIADCKGSGCRRCHGQKPFRESAINPDPSTTYAALRSLCMRAVSLEQNPGNALSENCGLACFGDILPGCKTVTTLQSNACCSHDALTTMAESQIASIKAIHTRPPKAVASEQFRETRWPSSTKDRISAARYYCYLIHGHGAWQTGALRQ